MTDLVPSVTGDRPTLCARFRLVGEPDAHAAKTLAFVDIYRLPNGEYQARYRTEDVTFDSPPSRTMVGAFGKLARTGALAQPILARLELLDGEAVTITRTA